MKFFLDDCDAGFYCWRGAIQKNNPNPTNTSGPCPIAHHCPSGTAKPLGCEEGTYMNLLMQAECFTCPAGYHCPNTISNYTDYPCPTGHFCSNGTKAETERPCPPGTFRNITLGQSVDDCFACPPGMYCSKDGLGNPEGWCDAGFYCRLGSDSKNPYSWNITTDCSCPVNITGSFTHFI